MMNVKVGTITKEELVDLIKGIRNDGTANDNEVLSVLEKVLNKGEAGKNNKGEDELKKRFKDLNADIDAIDKMSDVTGKNPDELISILLNTKSAEISMALNKKAPGRVSKAQAISNEILDIIHKNYPKSMGVMDILELNLAMSVTALSVNELLIKANNDAEEIAKSLLCNCPKCVAKRKKNMEFDIEAFVKDYKEGKIVDEVIAAAVYDGEITLEKVSSHFGNDVASRVLAIASKWLEEDKKNIK